MGCGAASAYIFSGAETPRRVSPVRSTRAGGGDELQPRQPQGLVLHQELAADIQAVQVGGQVLEVIGDQMRGMLSGGGGR
jgi:hypothetical protein